MSGPLLEPRGCPWKCRCSFRWPWKSFIFTLIVLPLFFRQRFLSCDEDVAICCFGSRSQCAQIGVRTSVLRLQSGKPTDAIARRIRVKRVGSDDGARCFYFILVVLACENDTSNFSLFSSLPPCNAFFRFHAVCYRVEIENCIFLDSVQKRREVDDNFEYSKYVVEEIILLFSIFLKQSAYFKYLEGATKLYKDSNS